MESDIEIIRSNRKFKPTQTQLIAFSFFAIIVIGGLLLTLPISSRSREWTPLLDALFTATSATCVTGLIVRDTYLHWSTFGQIVIIVMIQIGGLGLMSIITMFSVFLKRRISPARAQALDAVGRKHPYKRYRADAETHYNRHVYF